ncbi:hypothetical protein L6164_006673 [Bauhinia variegata]|nr:hypothetical protein L6164_006673 [Bauhinia variegata]
MQLQENGEQLDQFSSKVEVMERGGIGEEDNDDMSSSSLVVMFSDFNNSGVSMDSSASGERSSGNKETEIS